MLDPETVEIEGMTFQMLPMPYLTARKLDLQIVKLLTPLLGALDGLVGGDEKPEALGDSDDSLGEGADGDEPDGELAEQESSDAADDNSWMSSSIKFDKVAAAIGRALGALSDAQQEKLFVDMMFHVQRIDCTPGIPLTSSVNINRALSGSSLTVQYKLMYHVARYNKFTPFAGLGAGGKTGGILGSLVPSKFKKGLKLDRLAV